MKWTTYIFPALLVAAAWTACDDDDDNDNGQLSTNETDRTFVQNVSMANKTEIAFAQMAVTKASDSGVRAFAQHMIAEHSNADSELKDLADNISGIAMTDSMDQQHESLKTQLNSMSGSMFDSAYIASQVTDHQNVLNMFNTEISNGSQTQVKAYATKYKPHIQDHLDMADSLQTVLMDDNQNASDTTGTGSGDGTGTGTGTGG